MDAENFLIKYSYKQNGRVCEKSTRMDDSAGEEAARERFARMYPRRTIVSVRDITIGVRTRGMNYY